METTPITPTLDPVDPIDPTLPDDPLAPGGADPTDGTGGTGGGFDNGAVDVDFGAEPEGTNTDLNAELASYLALQTASQATILAYNTESNILNAAHSNKKAISDKIGNS